MSKKDVFPVTVRTWLGEQLGRGREGRDAANRHVMEVYLEPLVVYCRGHSLRRLGDPDDLVRGFLADRLGRDDYLMRWKKGEGPLRYWLMRSLTNYLHEQARQASRNARVALQPDFPTQGQEDGSEFDRACARSLISTALARACVQCDAEGLSGHWDAFVRHHLRGESYASIGETISRTPSQVAVMARTASHRFRDALRSLVAWPAATEMQVSDEVRELIRSLEMNNGD